MVCIPPTSNKNGPHSPPVYSFKTKYPEKSLHGGVTQQYGDFFCLYQKAEFSSLDMIKVMENLVRKSLKIPALHLLMFLASWGSWNTI